ncbi:hypothetical protein RND81_02G164200 [Saponaria officinalis]|uniref:Transposase n=1 Tax=Saponaria officinalis TaxID=3572 RepID=A0AAW1MU19_SAPOF
MHLNYSDGKLKHGIEGEIANRYGVSRFTIQRIWKVVQAAIIAEVNPNLKPLFKGAKPLDIDLNKVRTIPLRKRQNMYRLGKAIGCPESTIQRLVKKEKIRAHSNAIKPFLTDENMKARVKFVLSKILPGSVPRNPTFECMYNYVHINEKWFYMSRTDQKYYLLPDEDEPHRTCKSKRYIAKIIFMAAVARPRYGDDGVCLFDGKIGIFSFTEIVPAKRASKNRPKGVLETKAIESITKQVIKQCIINEIIPAIKQKWPANTNNNIIIQQDNAKPHISNNDPDFQEVANSDGFHISIQCQPSNSQDLNVNDLGFFRVIQTLKHEEAPTKVIKLVDAVIKAFDETNHKTLNYVWLSLMYCMNEILIDNGNNKYKLPHVGKRRLARLGILPTQVIPNKDVILARIEEQIKTLIDLNIPSQEENAATQDLREEENAWCDDQNA